MRQRYAAVGRRRRSSFDERPGRRPRCRCWISRRSTRRSGTRSSRRSRGSATASASSSGPRSTRSSASWPAQLEVGRRDRRLVRHRRAARRADGARHRSRRRGRHHHLLVLRDRRLHRPPRRDAASRRHRSRHLQHRSRRRSVRRSPPRTRADHAGALYGLCADMDPIVRRRGGTRHPVIEDACQAIGATVPRPAGGRDGRGRLLLVLSQQEPRRVRRRRAGHHRRRGAGARSCGCCAITAPSRSTSTSGSAATSASTRSRRRSCASSCRTCARWTAMRRANAARYVELFARRRARGSVDAAGRSRRLHGTSTTSSSSGCRDRDACARA